MAVVVGVGSGRTRNGCIHVRVVVAFLLGIFLGRNLEGGPSFEQRFFTKDPNDGISSTPTSNKSVGIRSSIKDLNDLPVRSTSHHDDHARPITKQQLLEPFVVPKVAGISVATILPGQRVKMHSHESMHEFFLVLEGRGTFFMTGDTNNDGGGRPVQQGSFAHVAPPDVHGIAVMGHSKDKVPLKVLLIGVVVEDQ